MNDALQIAAAPVSYVASSSTAPARPAAEDADGQSFAGVLEQAGGRDLTQATASGQNTVTAQGTVSTRATATQAGDVAPPQIAASNLSQTNCSPAVAVPLNASLTTAVQGQTALQDTAPSSAMASLAGFAADRSAPTQASPSASRAGWTVTLVSPSATQGVKPAELTATAPVESSSTAPNDAIAEVVEAAQDADAPVLAGSSSAGQTPSAIPQSAVTKTAEHLTPHGSDKAKAVPTSPTPGKIGVSTAAGRASSAGAMKRKGAAESQDKTTDAFTTSPVSSASSLDTDSSVPTPTSAPDAAAIVAATANAGANAAGINPLLAAPPAIIDEHSSMTTAHSAESLVSSRASKVVADVLGTSATVPNDVASSMPIKTDKLAGAAKALPGSLTSTPPEKKPTTARPVAEAASSVPLPATAAVSDPSPFQSSGITPPTSPAAVASALSVGTPGTALTQPRPAVADSPSDAASVATEAAAVPVAPVALAGRPTVERTATRAAASADTAHKPANSTPDTGSLTGAPLPASAGQPVTLMAHNASAQPASTMVSAGGAAAGTPTLAHGATATPSGGSIIAGTFAATGTSFDASQAATTTRSGALEVGFHDSTLGWLSVRASVDRGGDLHAALATANPAAASAVSGMLPSLGRFLQDANVSVQSVSSSAQMASGVAKDAAAQAGSAGSSTLGQGNPQQGNQAQYQAGQGSSAMNGSSSQSRQETPRDTAQSAVWSAPTSRATASDRVTSRAAGSTSYAAADRTSTVSVRI